jgi:uncharacterized membrane protein
MLAELLALRLIHIVSGIFWIGGGLYTFFFLGPALASTPAVMGQVMAASGTGRTFAIAGVFAILAGVFNFGVARPTMERAAAVGAALAAAADAAEKARHAKELDRLRKRGAIAGMLAVSCGLLAASGMAVARYV